MLVRFGAMAAAAVIASAYPWTPANALPVPCITCGNVALAGPGMEATVSYAVISGANFNAELGTHSIGFFGAVPQGTLGPIVAPAPSDFVYLYQPVNDGPSNDFIVSMSVTGGGVAGAITAGTRLESTLFVDPVVGLISAGPFGAATGLGAGPTVDFQNGLVGFPPTDPVPPWGACLGSVGTAQCSDAQHDRFPTSVVSSNWQETPSGVDLDPAWSGTVLWFASRQGPTLGNVSLTDVTGQTLQGRVPVPSAVPLPAVLPMLFASLASLAMAARARRRAA